MASLNPPPSPAQHPTGQTVDVDLDGYGQAYHVAYIEDTESAYDRVNALGDAIEAQFAALLAELDAAREALRRAEEDVADTEGALSVQIRNNTRMEARAQKAEAALLIVEANFREVEAERDALRQHILDIDAHATPYGDIPGEPGWVGTYLLTAGALHRALGKIGHSAPNCKAEEDLKLTQQAFDEYRESWRAATEATLAECERLRAERDALSNLLDQTMAARDQYKRERNAEAEENRRGRPVLEAARALRAAQRRDVIDRPITADDLFARVEAFRPIREAVDAAVDTYETQESTDG